MVYSHRGRPPFHYNLVTAAAAAAFPERPLLILRTVILDNHTNALSRMDVFMLPFDSQIIAPTTNAIRNKSIKAWLTFQRISIYNYKVQQLRLQYGNAANVSYYHCSDSERMEYNQGLLLYLKKYPEYSTNLSALIPEQI